MNAYELANWLQTGEVEEIDLNESAAMLRQQADRIAELEKTMGERLNDLNTRQVEDARTSLVSTPPYAYAVIEGEDGKENVSLQFDHPEMCGQKYKQSIPLFTTPQTKRLSDEEICGIAGKLSIATTEIENDWAFCVVEFARAIIKASRGEE